MGFKDKTNVLNFLKSVNRRDFQKVHGKLHIFFFNNFNLLVFFFNCLMTFLMIV